MQPLLARPGYAYKGTYAQRITEQYKEKIEVESELGQGSRFAVTLPVLD